MSISLQLYCAVSCHMLLEEMWSTLGKSVEGSNLDEYIKIKTIKSLWSTICHLWKCRNAGTDLIETLYMEVIFNWRTIVLQGCGGLCYLLLFTPLFHPSRLLQSARLAPCVIPQISLVTYFTHDSIHMSVSLSQFVPPSPSCAVSTRPFSMLTSSFLLCK